VPIGSLERILSATGIGTRYLKEFARAERWKSATRPPRRKEITLVRNAGEQTWDAVERARTQAALTASEAFARNVVDNSPDCILVLDLEGRMLSLNANGCRQMELEDISEQLMRPWVDFWPPESRSQVEQSMESARRGETAQFRGFCPTAKGNPRWWDVIVSPVRDAGVRPTRLLSVSRDITTRRRAEELLVERSRLSALGADIGAAVTRVAPLPRTLQGCVEAVVRHLDVAFARIWTLPVNGNVLELQASAGLYTHLDGPHSRVPVGAYKIGLIAKERRPHLTNDVLHDPRVSDRSWAERERMVAFAGYPLIVDDRLVGVMGLFSRHALDQSVLTALASVSDTISIGIERKRNEEELKKQAEELARLNTDLQQFAYAAAHDLSEPLRMMTSYTQLLSRKLEGRLDDDSREYMDQVAGAAKRMNRLLQDLLAYTYATREHDDEAIVLDLNEVLSIVLSNLGSAIDDSKAQILTQRLPVVQGHEAHFLQLFQNLISNAITYHGDAAPQVRVTAERTDTGWLIAVRDNGLGIESEHHLRIFGVFKRLHGKEIPGTGIGLAICQRIVENLGGRIWVESEGKGKGSAFFFTLPVAEELLKQS
jgi:PAS domain S-box-containing protein